VPKPGFNFVVDDRPATKVSHGKVTLVISAGGRIKIQCKASKNQPMETILNERVPTNKSQIIKVTVAIVEKDV